MRGCEAVALFADRARRADAQFALDGETGPVVARLVARLDGMPLAIELAAARVEALGVAQLLDRLDDRFGLLAAGDRLAAARQRSLAATVEWSYQLLDEQERRVFRAVSVFPGPFTLEAAEAVAGAGAGPAVLRLVDCSLLSPPRAGPDGRARYVMLETLRAYGAGLLAEAGERRRGGRRAGRVRAAGGRGGRGGAADQHRGGGRRPLAGCRGRHHAPGAGLGHGPRCGHGAAAGGRAGAVVAACAAGWRVGTRCCARLPGAPRRAARVVRRAVLARPDGAVTRPIWPGRWATSPRSATPSGTGAPSRALADCLAGRSVALSNLGRIAEAADDGRRSLALARELGYPAGEALALVDLSHRRSLRRRPRRRRAAGPAGRADPGRHPRLDSPGSAAAS